MAGKRILVPIDLAQESSWRKALPEAFGSVAQTGGAVTVMTVVPDIMAGLDWRYAIRGEMGGSEEFDMRKLVTEAEERLRQIVADELDYPFEKIVWIQGDTANTVDQAPTFGSQTIKRGGGQLRQAAAEAKATLLSMASNRLGIPIEALTTAQGVISADANAKKKVTYVDLLGGLSFNREVTGKVKPKSPSDYRVVGTPVPRKDIAGKILATTEYCHHVRLPGMLHARTLRPPVANAVPVRVDEASIAAIPGARVVRKGDFIEGRVFVDYVLKDGLISRISVRRGGDMVKHEQEAAA